MDYSNPYTDWFLGGRSLIMSLVEAVSGANIKVTQKAVTLGRLARAGYWL